MGLVEVITKKSEAITDGLCDALSRWRRIIVIISRQFKRDQRSIIDNHYNPLKIDTILFSGRKPTIRAL